MHSLPVPVAHGQLNPSHVLLDDDLNPRILNFGLPRLSITPGYEDVSSTEDAEYAALEARSDPCTTAGDVYSFAFLMLFVSPGTLPSHRGFVSINATPFH